MRRAVVLLLATGFLPSSWAAVAAPHRAPVPAWAVEPQRGTAANDVQVALFDTAQRDGGSAVGKAPRDCSATPPAAWSVPGVTDDGRPVAVKVLVVLDGVATARARALVAAAASAYAPLGVDLVATDYRRTRLVADEPATGGSRPQISADSALAQVKRVLGGKRPRGSDVVHVMTSKDLTLPGYGATPMGAAECAGGVRYDDLAFALSEDPGAAYDTYSVDPVGVTAIAGAAAEVVAHEIGHLLGALHEHKSCTEGVALADVSARDPSPCTVMSDVIDLASLRFGAVEAAVVRGYALAFAGSRGG